MSIKAKSQKGSVLFTVVVVSMMMMVLTASAISMVGHTNSESNREYRSKQAYFMASSCLEGFVSEVTSWTENVGMTPAQIEAEINKLKDIANSGTEIEVQIESSNGDSLQAVGFRDMGTCKIRVEENGSENNLKAIATAEYLGSEETVVAYFAVKPLNDQQPLNNALEIIGSDGSIYNNTEVYGNTTVSDIDSHTKNAIYVFKNYARFSGNISILGSMRIENATTLKKNPYYDPNATDGNQTPGATITVSRSLVLGNDVPTIQSELVKDSSNDDEPTYNYINAGEAMVISGNNIYVGSGSNNQVDIYTSLLALGKYDSLPSDVQSAITAAVPSEKVSDYVSYIKGGGLMQGANINGNIYTYDMGNSFNGDIYCDGINNSTINGDVYCSGDIIAGSSCNNLTINGNIYLLTGHSISGSGININGSIIYGDWTNKGGRAKRPALANENVQQYVYYPEHMLCLDGISSIKDTYANMYEDDGSGHQWKIKDSVKRVDDASFRNSSNVDYGNYGTSFVPTYVVTESCVLNGGDNMKILIDMDNAVENADGRHDIVVVLENGKSMSNDNMILIKNSTTDDDGDDQRFCYFVSDAGVGTVNNEYGSDNTSISTYDASSFKQTSFTLGKGYYMDLETYLQLKSGKTLNLSTEEDSSAYEPASSGNIMFLINEGSSLMTSTNDTVIQASIFAPDGTVSIQRGMSLNINPPGPTVGSSAVGVIGCVISRNYVTSANNSTIPYQPVSPNSMLPKAKGSKSVYDEGFNLVKYSNS